MVLNPILMRLLLAMFVTVGCCDCIEEFAPEVYLNPRNFNPHPYITTYNDNNNNDRSASINSNGPVLFPTTRDDRENEYYGNGISNVIDEHPYASVQQKNMRLQSDGHLNKETRVNPEVYKALTMHAAKVLNIPASGSNSLHNNNNNEEQGHVNGVSYGFAQQDYHQVTSPVSLSNYEYRYVTPNESYKPIHEANDNEGSVHNVEPIFVRGFDDLENGGDSSNERKSYSQVYINTPKFRLIQRQSHVSG